MALKRIVQTGVVDADAAPPPASRQEAARAPNGRFLNGRQLDPGPEPVTREWKNDDNPFEGPRAEIEQVLEAEKAAGAVPVDDKPPADAEPNPDPDAGEVPAAAAAPAPATTNREIKPTYLNPAQRADLARKLEEGKRERAKDAELKRINDEHAALTAKLNSPRLADRIAALGKSPEELLEDLLLGKADADDKAVAASAGATGEVAELRAKVAALEKRDTDREQARIAAEGQRVQQQAVTQLAATVTAAQGYHMIASLKQHGALLAEIEKAYDGSSDINAVTQLIADRVEGELRRMYPEVAAVLAKGGSVEVVDQTAAPAAKAKTKMTMGANGGTARAAATDEALPIDPSERHIAVKDRFFPTWKR